MKSFHKCENQQCYNDIIILIKIKSLKEACGAIIN